VKQRLCIMLKFPQGVTATKFDGPAKVFLTK
jgi:hypothetical protein